MFKEIVQNAQLNTSTSKQLFSFGHEPRFKEKDYKPINDKIYNIPVARDKRATSFGYGTKYDIQKQAKVMNVPAPNTYNQTSCFSKGQGIEYSMGVSRNNAKFNSILGNLPKNPGPGQYSHNSTLSNIQYTMREKTKQGFMSTFNQNPGPGKYESIPGLNEKGKFPISKFKSYGVAIINPTPNNSVKTLNVPGPGTYEQKNDLGKAVLSKYTDKKGLPFPNVGRSNSVSKSFNNPGPGTYKHTSDFGYYEKSILSSVNQSIQQ